MKTKNKKSSASRKAKCTGTTKPSDIMELYLEVQRYVETRGGKVVVIGGVQTMQWPGDRECNFTIGIKCTGRKPAYANKD